MERELKIKTKQLTTTRFQEQQVREEINSYPLGYNIKQPIIDLLKDIIDNHNLVTKTRITKKLNTLYSGYHCFNNNNKFGSRVMFKENKNRFINLSNYELSNDEVEFLNLGLNYHLQPKYDHLTKKTEIEMLYQNILNLEEKNEVVVNPDISNFLVAESSKNRFVKAPSKFSKKLKQAAFNLKQNNEIIIRKADKASIYVILNKKDYLDKINGILSNQEKFVKINKDPTNMLKNKANKLITTLNAAQDSLKIPKIIGDYQPGYIYGNVKTHKPNNPVRPIISQVLTPTYNLAKNINTIINPYIPNNYTLKSTNEFIDLLNANNCIGLTASLDVESLFTNVPVNETIKIIIQQVYNHPTLPPPKIPKNILEELLNICTKELPFICPQGHIYKQVDGVAMGSPLGPCFANFYMGNLENEIFKNIQLKPNIYGRYVDDIFLQISSEKALINLKQKFEENSVLKFTYELNVNNKIPFLDVVVDTQNNLFKTTVYRKTTNEGFCLNANSECTNRYKNSVTSSYINRAYKITKSWEDFHTECQHFKQLLINNNFSNKMVDEHINKFLTSKLQLNSNINEEKVKINIFYKNQQHKNSHIDEKMIKNIIKNNVKPTDNKKKVNLNI